MKRFRWVIAILLIAAGLGGYKIWQGKEPNTLQVRTTIVKRGEIISDLTDVGRVTSSTKTSIFSETDGIIKEVLVDEGDTVKKGEELVRFDLREARITLLQAENKLNQARLELKDAERELNRTRELYSARAASSLKLDTDKTRFDRGLIEVGLAEEGLNLSRIKLSKLRIVSPQTGVVVKKEVKDGQAVQPGTLLFVIADLTNLEVEVDTDEVDIPQVKVGQSVIVTSEGLPGQEFKGRMIKIAPQAEIKEKTSVVKTTIRLNSSEGLKMGSQVDVRIITNKKEDILILPFDVLVEEDGKNFVFLYQEGLARKREITTGISNLEGIEVVSGLKEGDEIIIPRGLVLKDQERVRKETE